MGDALDAAIAAAAQPVQELITATIKVVPNGRECSVTFPADLTHEEAFNLQAAVGQALVQVFSAREAAKRRIILPRPA